jgi:uncharacterized OB-fold protein
MTQDLTTNPDPEAQRYLDGLGRGVILLQHCPDCDRPQFPPRAFCVRCGGGQLSWDEVDGHGTVYAKTVNRRAPEDAFARLVPYVVALVDLDAGARVMARADCPVEEVSTGMRVRVFPDPAPPVSPGLVFRPQPSDRDGA